MACRSWADAMSTYTCGMARLLLHRLCCAAWHSVDVPLQQGAFGKYFRHSGTRAWGRPSLSYENKFDNPLRPFQNNTPPRIGFVEDIIEYLLLTFPEFWKLSQAYFNGELRVKADKTKQIEFKVLCWNLISLNVGCGQTENGEDIAFSV